MNIDPACRNCKGKGRAVYFSEQAWADDERPCHVCRDRPVTPNRLFGSYINEEGEAC